MEGSGPTEPRLAALGSKCKVPLADCPGTSENDIRVIRLSCGNDLLGESVGGSPIACSDAVITVRSSLR